MKKSIALLLAGSMCVVTLKAQVNRGDSAAISRLPARPYLPDPLLLETGSQPVKVTSPALWQQKKADIRKQYQHWVSGTVPPPPGNVQAKVISEKTENNVLLRVVELNFGPDHKAKMTVELMIPPSAKKLPVFLTQWTHRGWAQVAVRRGYIGCIYAGADGMDDTKDYQEIFKGYDFATLMKRAWGAARVVDYLYTLPQVDTAAIGITGHSRNGKQSLMAAAFDERIKAVITSSGGTGAECTFRYSDERFESESVESITRVFPYWFHPRLRLFSGREQQLPVDQNLLLASIAPRGLMIVSAMSENQGNAWGIEQTYRSAKSAYSFLHAEDQITLNLRQGRHQHSAREAESFVDFFDGIFKRGTARIHSNFLHDYSFEKWQQLSGEKINPLDFPVQPDGAVRKGAAKTTFLKDSIRRNIQWMLGEMPPFVAGTRPYSRELDRNKTYPNDYLAEIIGIPNLPATIRKMDIGPYPGLGENLWGAMYVPAAAVEDNKIKGTLPLVIFLHEYSYATGSWQRTGPLVKQYTDKGFAVLTFDFAGFGTRAEEALQFYNRYPNWSLMGKMVADTRNILNDVYTRMDFVDTAKVYLAGYSLGGTVALVTAALDDRVKGVAVASAFSSLRKDNIGTEGVRHFSHLHGLLPRLGFFIGQEQRIPVDFDGIISCIAPRPLLILAPEKDRHYTLPVVKEMTGLATAVYQQAGAKSNLVLETPVDYNRFPAEIQQRMADWLTRTK